ncbi:MAG: 4-hydroxythreonine-4-phosphate dehydrogenase PdxA [Pseudomonadota bacterium]
MSGGGERAANAETAPLGLSMGDPLGVGPEVCAKAMAAPPAARPLFVLGDPAVMARAAAMLEAPPRIEEIAAPEAAEADPRRLAVLPTAPLKNDGSDAAQAGAAAAAAILRGADLALEGRIAGLVTAPIDKAHLAAAGVPHPGHTEMLAERAGGAAVSMMLANDELAVVLVSIHVSLRDALGAITFEAELAAIRRAHLGAQALGVAAPRVAVAGLNPHAGEGGLFGREEIDIIAPAIEAARAEGIDASGPWPGDTVFMNARGGRFDIVVAQYHDQGLIPVKYLGVAAGVNVTLGLPFIRTSPDHGSARDIAWRGRADPGGMRAAIKLADKLHRARN